MAVRFAWKNARSQPNLDPNFKRSSFMAAKTQTQGNIF
jgi:hypothetical protein